jgi:hypothetical protein
MSRSPLRSILAAGVLALALALAVADGLANRPRVQVPAPTADGEFDGTWWRREPAHDQAVWLRRAASGGYEIRFYWKTDENFLVDTNWAEHTDFTFKGKPGVFEIAIDPRESTDDRLVARYLRRQQGVKDTQLLEEGELVLYRSAEGRNLVWMQERLRSHVTVAEPIAPYQEDEKLTESSRMWIFQRAAKRLLALDEIPW